MIDDDKTKKFKELGITIKPLLERNPIQKEYHERMARVQLAERGPAKPKPVKPDGMTTKEWYASMQSPSTRAIMDGTYKDKYDISKWEANAHLKREDFESDDAFWKAKTGERSVSVAEFMAYKSHQRRSKNTLGQSDESAFTEEARDRAAHAFVVSPPALLSANEIAGLTKLEPMGETLAASIVETKEPEPDSFWSTPFWKWLLFKDWFKW